MRKKIFIMATVLSLVVQLSMSMSASGREYNPFGPAIRTVRPEVELVLEGTPCSGYRPTKPPCHTSLPAPTTAFLS